MIKPVKSTDLKDVQLLAGDVVVFSSFLVHRSGTNSSPDIRWSCHFRYNNLAETTFVERIASSSDVLPWST